MKAYVIMMNGSFGSEAIYYVSNKTKAVSYIKSCIKERKKFTCYRYEENYQKTFGYSEEYCLNEKEILKWRYLDDVATSYYVKEIEIF